MKTAISFKDRVAGIKELKLVEEKLHQVVASSSKPIHELARHLLWRRGKRLRPLLVILSASFGINNLTALVDTAAAAELIHTASLIHDDIIDEAGDRRGSKSINERWGNKWAVLTGDFLFAKAYSLLIRHPKLGVLEPMTQAILLMCEGEIEQLGRSGRSEVSGEDVYYSYIYKKTAFFISACCLAGARVANLSKKEAQALQTYGYQLGLAFQITDDVFDLTLTNNDLGKPVGSDIRQKVLTLPLVYMLADENNRALLKTLVAKDTLTDADVETLASRAHTSGAIREARGQALCHVHKAKEALQPLEDSINRDILFSLADYVLERQV